MNQATFLPDAVDRTWLRQVIKETYTAHHGAVPIDRFLCRPRDEIAFCERIKAVTGASDLKDEEILQTLMNLRKTGEIKATKEDPTNPVPSPRV
jgi:hypothetical protein